MSKTLKSCPFCGGDAELIEIGSRGYLVKCSVCSIKTPRATKAGTATRVWNTRKPIKRIIEQLERAKSYSVSPQFSKGINGAIETILRGGAE